MRCVGPQTTRIPTAVVSLVDRRISIRLTKTPQDVTQNRAIIGRKDQGPLVVLRGAQGQSSTIVANEEYKPKPRCPARRQVHMVVEDKCLRKFLLSKKAGIDGRSPGDETRKGLVAAAAKLLPLPWDAAVGYGNPRKKVRHNHCLRRASRSRCHC